MGLPQSAKALNILKGTDYLSTPGAGGTSYDFGGPIGNVVFRGLSIGPGNTDTKIKRLEDAVFDDNNDGTLERTSDTINIELAALSLKSVNSINVNGFLYDVLVGLNNTPSTGSMTINHNTVAFGGGNLGFDDSGTLQGTFTSQFTVNAEATFTPVNGGSSLSPVSTSFLLTNTGADWSHTPPAGALLVTGPAGDGNANTHTSPPPGFGDFYPGPAVHGPIDTHETIIAVPWETDALPVVGSTVLFGFGLWAKSKFAKSNKNVDLD
ncbi:MAG: hypothetical protein KA717_09040 [Woronichinia naegeliana WA131]|uniref:Uncharacterized protein n=1 Tax=Woronichinia naegeliana WA131 TaxID=2824559 RepID=A0A977PYT6_9CYAN|nr:MAG: hypothetical protein KA717_09040 [Woronichinia naegeliana WA131]